MLTQQELARIKSRVTRSWTLSSNNKDQVNQRIMEEVSVAVMKSLKTMRQDTNLEVFIAESK